MSTANESRRLSHKGDHRVSRSELAWYPTPEPTATWFPIPHATVANTVIQTLNERGYTVRASHGYSRRRTSGSSGTIDLTIPLTRWDAPGQVRRSRWVSARRSTSGSRWESWPVPVSLSARTAFARRDQLQA